MHKYVRSGKFKNTNCGYALVRGIVFGSIYEAEEYCTAKGYDPDVWIEADSDAVLSRCQQNARAALPCLCQALEEQRILCETLGHEARAEAAALEAAEEKHELGWEVHRNWLQHAAGKVGGCNWAAYGLFGIPAEHDIVVVAPGDQVDVYPFADGEQEVDNG